MKRPNIPENNAADDDRRGSTGDVGPGLWGRRKGKALRPYHNRLVDELLPRLRIDPTRPIADPLGLFDPRVVDVRLEIGFGGGERLADEASDAPQIGFIGCEPFVNGVAKLLAAIDAQNLRNIRICDGDAMTLIQALPSSSLSRVDLFYPDPWPKRRHRKRRFLSDSALCALARVMRPGANLRVATDIDDYAAFALAAVSRSADFEWDAKAASDWLTPWPDWLPTRYEAKARREGRRSVYLTFTRAGAAGAVEGSRAPYR